MVWNNENNIVHQQYLIVYDFYKEYYDIMNFVDKHLV